MNAYWVLNVIINGISLYCVIVYNAFWALYNSILSYLYLDSSENVDKFCRVQNINQVMTFQFEYLS